MHCFASCAGRNEPRGGGGQVVTGTPQVLVADGLSNTFDGARFQFEDLQLTVCRGQKLGLVGINGCGKSTLLKVGFCVVRCKLAPATGAVWRCKSIFRPDSSILLCRFSGVSGCG